MLCWLAVNNASLHNDNDDDLLYSCPIVYIYLGTKYWVTHAGLLCKILIWAWLHNGSEQCDHDIAFWLQIKSWEHTRVCVMSILCEVQPTTVQQFYVMCFLILVVSTFVICMNIKDFVGPTNQYLVAAMSQLSKQKQTNKQTKMAISHCATILAR